MIIVVYKPDYKYFKEYINSFISPDDSVLLFSYENPHSFEMVDQDEYMFVNTFDTNVIIDCHRKGNRISILNTEQLTRQWYFEKYKNDLSNLIKENIIPTLYDYSIYNSTIIPHGLEVKDIIRYISKKSEIPDYSLKVVYDVAFCGTRSDRREKILSQLENRGISVYRINEWGEQRDIEIQKCKIMINIHYSDEYRIFESIRCDRWLAFGKTVVTEYSLDVSHSEHEKLIISYYDNLVDTVINILKWK
jgi:hypothetical protein